MQIRSRDVRTPQLAAPDTLIEAALQGFDNPEASTNAIWSSQTWLAFYAGQAIANRQLVRPTKVCSSRGYSVRVTSGRQDWIVAFNNDLTNATVSAKATRL